VGGLSKITTRTGRKKLEPNRIQEIRGKRGHGFNGGGGELNQRKKIRKARRQGERKQNAHQL